MGGGRYAPPPQQRAGVGLGPAGRGLNVELLQTPEPLLTRARVAVSATFAMVGGGAKWPPL